MRFVSWEPSGSMRQAAGGSASSHARRPPDHRMTAKYASAPSALPSEAPAPKRRKLEGSPVSACSCTLSTQGIVPAGTPSASSVSSETLVGERVVSPFTRSFLVSWISVLDSMPELELITYLPHILDGLLCAFSLVFTLHLTSPARKYLSDPTEDVRIAAENQLAEFLREIREVTIV
ncbi:hypothetical protein F5148DRAFT_17533 [Russula earlei]|uniref:Uncharacterized protein n=1 Tax=Russula earlei TaxID=71964 RepID=A0ACC0UKR7_9AGAM|nr:hypothetical protein F5148DRAFT_17533 [Russula earlei]